MNVKEKNVIPQNISLCQNTLVHWSAHKPKLTLDGF